MTPTSTFTPTFTPTPPAGVLFTVEIPNIPQVFPGQVLPITYIVRNHAAFDLQNAVINILLPEPYEPYGSLPPGAIYDPLTREIRIDVGVLPPGGRYESVVFVRVDPSFGGPEWRTIENELTYDQGASSNLTLRDDVALLTGDYPPEEFQITRNFFRPDQGEEVGVRFFAGRSTTYVLTVYNSAGERVRVIRHKTWVSEKTLLFDTWDGSNDYGEKVAAGVYLLHLETREAARIAKVVVLR